MGYSIGEAAKITGLSVSTLRYYDRNDLIPGLGRSQGGTRVFTDQDIESIRVIECLKSTGMQLKDIKQFMAWCDEGDSTISDRLSMFQNRLQEVEAQINDLQWVKEVLKFKCWYYESAASEGTTERLRNTLLGEIPEEYRQAAAYLRNESQS